MPWLTPETLPTTFVCRQVLIPEDVDIIAAVTGALLDLTRASNWEQHGAITPDEISSAMATMVMEFWEGCAPSMIEPIIFKHQGSSGTNGGTFTLGAWRTRPITHLLNDVEARASLAANIITLQPGRYIIEGYAVAYNVGDHQIRLYNVDAAGEVFPGSVVRAVGNVATTSHIKGLFQVNTPTQYRIEHRCETTLATIGMGQPASWTEEVYAEFLLWPLN